MPLYNQTGIGADSLSGSFSFRSAVASDRCIGRVYTVIGELYYLKTENRAGLSKITVYVKKEIRADEMQQLWDKLRRKVNDVQTKLPAGAGPSVVNDDFGDVLGVFYGLTGEGHSYRELEEQAKLIKNELLKVKDVAKIEIYGVQSPTIDVILSPSVMARSGITTVDISVLSMRRTGWWMPVVLMPE